MKSSSGTARYWIALAVVGLLACEAGDELEGDRAAPQEGAAPVAAAGPESRPQAREPDFSVAGLSAVEVESFLDSLKAAVANDDRRAVASMVRYPITVQLDGRRTMIDSAADFVSRYPDIVNEQVRGAVLAQELPDLFVNWQGVMIGRGEVWFSAVYDDPRDDEAYHLKVIAVNNNVGS